MTLSEEQCHWNETRLYRPLFTANMMANAWTYFFWNNRAFIIVMIKICVTLNEGQSQHNQQVMHSRNYNELICQPGSGSRSRLVLWSRDVILAVVGVVSCRGIKSNASGNRFTLLRDGKRRASWKQKALPTLLVCACDDRWLGWRCCLFLLLHKIKSSTGVGRHLILAQCVCT